MGMPSSSRYDAATRAGRPAPMQDESRINYGYVPEDSSVDPEDDLFYEVTAQAYERLFLEVCNKSGSDTTFSVYIVPAGGTIGDQWARFRDAPLSAKETLVLPRHYTLDNGDKVYVTAGTANVVTAWANLELMR